MNEESNRWVFALGFNVEERMMEMNGAIYSKANSTMICMLRV